MKNRQGGFAEVVVVFIIVVAIGGLIIWGLWGLSSVDSTPVQEEQNEIEKSNTITEAVNSAVPVPQLTSSSERKNVAKRAELFNDESKVSYIYLVSYGKVMAFYTVKGKVSSLRSYMTAVDKIVKGNGDVCDVWSSSSCYVVEAPDIDGTYGENVEGIFFFTTEGAYVEWKGEYMMSDQPLRLATPPALVREIQ